MTSSDFDNPDEERRAAIRMLVGQCIELTESGETQAAEHLLAQHPDLAGDVRSRLQKLGAAGLLESGDSSPRIEGYRILEHIGHGGMGEIYLAERRNDLCMRLAVKVIKQGMDTREILARFEAEKQALARMDHAHIARIHDVGSTASGQSYFAMDYIPGLPITQFCDDLQLSVNERLRLMLDVCSAVQHAHHKGIIHRDLKPSNLLVTEQDGAFTVKVIDFGVAKAIHGAFSDATVHTVHGMILGTPEYMSPEQAGRDALDVDTRTDVYSLGVILYELLVGELPIQFARAGLTDYRAMIRDTPLERPSTRIEELRRQGSADGRDRGMESRALHRSLRGELDWVVLKALAKERRQRYATPAELAAEIRRYLDGEPVEARPPSRIYRGRLFVRRHRMAVGAAAVALLMLVSGLASSLMFYSRAKTNNAALEKRTSELALANSSLKASTDELEKANADLVNQTAEAKRQRDDAEKAWGVATNSIAALEQTVEFQFKMMQDLDPSSAGVTLIRKLRESLASRPDKDGSRERRQADFDKAIDGVNPTDAARHFLDAEFLAHALDEASKCKDTDVRAELMGATALVYERLGFADKCLRIFLEVVKLRQERLGAKHIKTLNARTHAAVSRHTLGDNNTALQELEEILKELLAIEGLDPIETAQTRIGLARVLGYINRHAEAESHLRLVAKLYSERLGPDDPMTLTTQVHLAVSLRSRGQLEAAGVILRTCLSALQKNLGSSPITARATLEMGILAYHAGQSSRAESFVRQAVELTRKHHGSDHPSTLSAENSLARVLHALGRLEDARAMGQRVVDRSARVLGNPHPDTLRRRLDLADVLSRLGRFGEQASQLRMVLSGQSATLGEDDPDTLRTMTGLAVALLGANRPEEALFSLRKAWAMGKRVLEDGHPTRHSTQLATGIHLARALMKSGNLDAARAQITETEELGRRTLKPDHPSMLYAMGVRARILHAAGAFKEAESSYQSVIAGMQKSAGPNDHNVLAYMTWLARMYAENNRLDEAEKLSRDVRARAGSNATLIETIDKILADVARRRGKVDK